MRASLRLHKYIANCGYCSRRHAELLIAAGLVRVNDRIVAEPGRTIDPGRDRVTINGEAVVPPPPRTLMLHKSAGFISGTHDTHERLTVMDLLPRSLAADGVVPVGRLDLDTEGLLLMTNDGELHHRITHPRYECPKEYLARVRGHVTPPKLERLAQGVLLDDGPARPAAILSSERRGAETEIRIELTEGRKREVKRMFAAIGHEVARLVRLRIGPLRLGDLAPGAWRALSGEESAALRRACGLR